MEAESFFARWSKRNVEAAAQKRSLQPDAPPQEPALPPPSLDDVALLTHDSDFKRFVAPGVDEAVRRSAMKKLFADPRFNVMDGLDVYIEDYHTFTPIPAAMLAALNHAKQLLDPLAQIESQLKTLVEAEPERSASDDTPEQIDPPAEEQIRHDDPVQGM